MNAARAGLPALLAGLLFTAITALAAQSEGEAIDRLLFRLNQGRGVAGPPVATAQALRVQDPRAVELAGWLRQARAGLAVPAAVVANGGAPALAVAGAEDPPSQRAALQRLAAAVGPQLEVHLRPENGTIRQIRGGVLGAAVPGPAKAGLRERAEATGRTFLRDHAALLRVKDPDREFRLERSEPDGLGGRHLRFEQRLGDLPVWPASLSVHLDAQANVVLLDGGYVPSPDQVDTEPKVAAQDALLRAKASVPGGMRGEAGDPDLIVFAPLDEAPRLAWRISLNVGFVQSWRFVVDAQDGRILRRSNRILDAGVAGSGTDLGGANRNLNVWQANNQYYLIDTSKPMFQAGSDPVQSPQGAITIADAREVKINDLKNSDLFLITSANPALWDVADGVSAAYNFSQTYDYYLTQHQRNSLDGQGGNITAVVRIGDYANASWNGGLKIMLFGMVEPYANALDVVGHELTHGLTESSAGLVYENQSGALNESFSDIFGEMVESYVEGQNDWKMGTKLSKYLRDMADPGSLTIGGLNKPYPSKMSEYLQLPNTDDADHGGVHLNSSIPNHCFWLLAEGMSGAIGRTDASRIFLRCLTQHLQAQSQFVDTRLGCIAAAEALFGAGSTQAQKTAEAFDAVEIFAAPETPAPPSVPVVQGEDSTMFLTLDFDFFFNAYPVMFRRETAQGDGTGGSGYSDSVAISRPAVTGDGSLALYVDANHNLWLGDTADPFSQQFYNFNGQVHSVALSPDGRFGAFIFQNAFTGQAENRISIIDFNDPNAELVTFELLAPTVDGAPVDGVLYADAMTFSTDSQVLIYDTLSQMRFGAGPTVQRWSISALNLATGKTSIVVPPIEGLDTGNPSMGRAGNRYLAFDAVEEGTVNSHIIVMDLFSGQAAQVDLVEGMPNYLGLGYPTFSGDESALVYAQRDPQAFSGYSLVRLPLTADRLSAAGNPTLWLEDAFLGVIYRRGAFTGENALPTVSITSPGNGAVLTPGQPVTIEVTASDSDGNVALVEIYDGNAKLGEIGGAPFSLNWTPASAGSHRLIARATDNFGGVTDSAAVTVTAGGGPVPSPSLGISRIAGGVRLVVSGSAGDYVIQQSSNLKQWSDIYPVTIGAGGQGSVDDTGGPANNPTLFYRARTP